MRGSGEYGYTPRWTAPEMFLENPISSKESDVFSFAMVAIEVGESWAIGISVVLTITSGFLWGGSIPWDQIQCGTRNHYEWRAAKPTYSLQFD